MGCVHGGAWTVVLDARMGVRARGCVDCSSRRSHGVRARGCVDCSLRRSHGVRARGCVGTVEVHTLCV